MQVARYAELLIGVGACFWLLGCGSDTSNPPGIRGPGSGGMGEAGAGRSGGGKTSGGERGDAARAGQGGTTAGRAGSTSRGGAGGGRTGGASTAGGEGGDAGQAGERGPVGDAGSAGASECDEQPCKLTSPQCGCDSGEQCTISQAIHGRVCVAQGTAHEGQSCTDAFCAPGLACIAVASDTAICERFCSSDTDSDCPGGASQCVLSITDEIDRVLGEVCAVSCSPITNLGCPDDTSCQAWEGEQGPFTHCYPFGATAPGEPCSTGNDCGPGFTCVGLELSVPVCAQYCNLDAPECDDGLDCFALFEAGETAGGVAYGICGKLPGGHMMCDVPTTATPTLSVAGTVSGETVSGGNPLQQSLAGATVELYDDGNQLLDTKTTNAQGQFAFTSVPTSGLPFSFHLAVTAAGYLAADYYSPAPVAGDATGIFITTFTPAFVDVLPALTGVTFDPSKCLMFVGVTDCDGNPVSGATISSDGGGQLAYFVDNFPQTSATSTDASGVALIVNSNPGTSNVSAQVDGAALSSRAVTCVAGHIVETKSSGCSEYPCKLTSPQCGCDSGEQCIVYGANRTCVAQGAGEEGEPCASLVSCAPGLSCSGLGPDTALCEKYCTGDSDCVQPGGRCVLTLSDGKGGVVSDATVCTVSCDPMSSVGCPSGTKCHVLDMSKGQGQPVDVFTHCLPAGTAQQDAPCPSGDECAPGFICVDRGVDEVDPVCTAYCSSDDPSCGAGLHCVALFEPGATLDGVTYGFCL